MSNLRSTVGQVVSRRVDRVFARSFPGSRQELYFHFDDGTYLEIFGTLQCSSYLRSDSIASMRARFEAQSKEASFVEYPRSEARAV